MDASEANCICFTCGAIASAYMLGHQSLLELVAADSRAPKHNKHAPDNGSREKKNIYIYMRFDPNPET